MADIGVNVTQAFKERDMNQLKLLSLPYGVFDQSLESSNQERKPYYRRKVVIREAPGDNKDHARIYVKGAPEEVIELCTHIMTERGEQREMREDDKANILNHVVSMDMAKMGLKPISYAFKEIECKEIQKLVDKTNGVESEEFRWYVEEKLIYLATFGLEDQLREGLQDSIDYLRNSKGPGDGDQKKAITIRILTGDHIETAKRVAIDCGLFDEDDLQRGCYTGEQFIDSIGPYLKEWDYKE